MSAARTSVPLVVDSVSPARARRIALGAQGFATAAPESVGTRQIHGLIERLGLLQIDSVNVFERSHYLPVFARLGSYDRALLDRIAFETVGRRARYVEYVAHEAALIPVDTLAALRWRMRALRLKEETDPRKWPASHRPMLDWLRAELAAEGPMAASEVEHAENRRRGPWWGWSDVKLGLEYLFRWGEIFTAGRTRFERRYGLAEHVLPPGALDVEMTREDGIRHLVRHAMRAHGVGTASDIADYFRLRVDDTTRTLRELVDAGEVVPVQVPGWRAPAFLDAAARTPRRIDRVALLSPFDPVVWWRERALRLFDFDYRIEIYTPAAKRRYGYYSLPILMDDAIVGRIDLKSDRQRRMLRVQSAWTEPHALPDTEERLAPLLRQTAAWQGLDGVEVARWGDLAPRLARALGVPLRERDRIAASL